MPSLLAAITSSNQQARADTGAMFPISVYTVGDVNAASITLSNIPSTYTHLQVRFLTLNSATGATFFRLNGDTAGNYSNHYLYGNGSTAVSAGTANSTQLYIANHGTSIPTIGIIDILDYKNTNKYKTTRTISGNETNSGNNTASAIWSGNWRNTNAVTTFEIYPSGANFTQFTTVALYGIL